MKRPRTLSAAFVRNVREPGRYGDGRGGHGLSLLVKPTANGRTSRTWCQQVRINGRWTSIGLGAYPLVGLAEARRRALHNRREIEAGRDPRPGHGTPTVREATEAVLALHADNWKPGSRTPTAWRNSFDTYCAPIMDKPVDAVTTADLLAIVAPLWLTKPPTARQLRTRTSTVMRWAVGAGHRSDDPAGDTLLAALPKQTNGRATHHRALPPEQVGPALAKIDGSRAALPVKLLARFVALTCCRHGEARGAIWSEIDHDARTWTIPAARTKQARQHVIPLSREALDVLDRAADIADGSGLVFAYRGRPVAASTISALFRRLNIGTAHGLRSSFRVWVQTTGQSRELAEHALGHRVGGQVEQAYARSTMIERRRELMQDWAAFLTT